MDFNTLRPYLVKGTLHYLIKVSSMPKNYSDAESYAIEKYGQYAGTDSDAYKGYVAAWSEGYNKTNYSNKWSGSEARNRIIDWIKRYAKKMFNLEINDTQAAQILSDACNALRKANIAAPSGVC